MNAIKDNVMAALDSALDAGTFGLYDTLMAGIKPEWHKESQEQKNRAPVGNVVGTVAGSVAPMLLNPTLGLATAGKSIAKYLSKPAIKTIEKEAVPIENALRGKISEAMTGQTPIQFLRKNLSRPKDIVQLASEGALAQAIAPAVGTALGVNDIQDVGKSALIGGALGGGLGALSKGTTKYLDTKNEAINAIEGARLFDPKYTKTREMQKLMPDILKSKQAELGAANIGSTVYQETSKDLDKVRKIVGEELGALRKPFEKPISFDSFKKELKDDILKTHKNIDPQNLDLAINKYVKHSHDNINLEQVDSILGNINDRLTEAIPRVHEDIDIKTMNAIRDGLKDSWGLFAKDMPNELKNQYFKTNREYAFLKDSLAKLETGRKNLVSGKGKDVVRAQYTDPLEKTSTINPNSANPFMTKVFTPAQKTLAYFLSPKMVNAVDSGLPSLQPINMLTQSALSSAIANPTKEKDEQKTNDTTQQIFNRIDKKDLKDRALKHLYVENAISSNPAITEAYQRLLNKAGEKRDALNRAITVKAPSGVIEQLSNDYKKSIQEAKYFKKDLEIEMSKNDQIEEDDFVLKARQNKIMKEKQKDFDKIVSDVSRLADVANDLERISSLKKEITEKLKSASGAGIVGKIPVVGGFLADLLDTPRVSGDIAEYNKLVDQKYKIDKENYPKTSNDLDSFFKKLNSGVENIFENNIDAIESAEMLGYGDADAIKYLKNLKKELK